MGREILWIIYGWWIGVEVIVGGGGFDYRFKKFWGVCGEGKGYVLCMYGGRGMVI
jgi:hypothetical protein